MCTLVLALAWLALLLVVGMWVGNHLQLSGDLRKFMPAARTPAQKLLMEELGEVAHELTYDVQSQRRMDRLRAELVQVAAMASAWIDSIDHA